MWAPESAVYPGSLVPVFSGEPLPLHDLSCRRELGRRHMHVRRAWSVSIQCWHAPHTGFAWLRRMWHHRPGVVGCLLSKHRIVDLPTIFSTATGLSHHYRLIRPQFTYPLRDHHTGVHPKQAIQLSRSGTSLREGRAPPPRHTSRFCHQPNSILSRRSSAIST